MVTSVNMIIPDVRAYNDTHEYMYQDMYMKFYNWKKNPLAIIQLNEA